MTSTLTPSVEIETNGLPLGDDAVWRGAPILWKEPESWMPRLSAWLLPRLRSNGLERLKPGQARDICWDDSDWRTEVLDSALRAGADAVALALSDALHGATLRAYHGCRTEDAGSYIRSGLKRHNRAQLTRQVEEFVASSEDLAWMRGRIGEKAAAVDNTLDEGRLYVVLSDEAMIEHYAHYLIYGSEWICAVLGFSGHRFLKSRGVPTMIELDLPLNLVRSSTRDELAKTLLQEWTRRICNTPDWVAPVDFGICMEIDLPAEFVVGHYHPQVMRDPLHGREPYRSPASHCAHCGP